MPGAFLPEKGAYMMLGRRIPNLSVLTSLRRGVQNMVVFTERRAARSHIYWLLHHFEKNQNDNIKIYQNINKICKDYKI